MALTALLGGELFTLGQGMRPGAKLVLIEFKEGKLPEGPPEHGKIPRADLLKLAARRWPDVGGGEA